MPNDSEFISKRLRYLETIQVRFWNIWRSLYLQELTSFHFKDRNKAKQPKKVPKVGEIVLIFNDKLPRNQWPLGKILELIKSNDDKVRQVKVQPVNTSPNDKRKKSVLYRSVTHIYPLEINN